MLMVNFNLIFSVETMMMKTMRMMKMMELTQKLTMEIMFLLEVDQTIQIIEIIKVKQIVILSFWEMKIIIITTIMAKLLQTPEVQRRDFIKMMIFKEIQEVKQVMTMKKAIRMKKTTMIILLEIITMEMQLQNIPFIPDLSIATIQMLKRNQLFKTTNSERSQQDSPTTKNLLRYLIFLAEVKLVLLMARTAS